MSIGHLRTKWPGRRTSKTVAVEIILLRKKRLHAPLHLYRRHGGKWSTRGGVSRRPEEPEDSTAETTNPHTLLNRYIERAPLRGEFVSRDLDLSAWPQRLSDLVWELRVSPRSRALQDIFSSLLSQRRWPEVSFEIHSTGSEPQMLRPFHLASQLVRALVPLKTQTPRGSDPARQGMAIKIATFLQKTRSGQAGRNGPSRVTPCTCDSRVLRGTVSPN